MTEKVLNNKKNGMLILLLLSLVYLLAIAAAIYGGISMDAGHAYGIPVFALGIIWVCVGWIFFMGLKVLKPQEALVLTLFGKYIGTLKGAGFYWVNRFKIVVSPLNIHHNREGSLCMTTFFLCHFVRTSHGQISSRP